jgi:hypothetical protein
VAPTDSPAAASFVAQNPVRGKTRYIPVSLARPTGAQTSAGGVISSHAIRLRPLISGSIPVPVYRFIRRRFLDHFAATFPGGAGE